MPIYGKRIMIVYKAKNKINGKCYIGITTKTLEQRKRAHEKSTKYNNRKFCNALIYYGFESFEWSILDTAETIFELQTKEVYYISKYDSMCNGYNLTTGGELNKEYSIETLIKMKDARVEWHTTNKNGFSGKYHSETTRRIMSEKAIGRISPNKDTKLSDIHKQNLSIAQYKWLECNEHSFKGKHQSDKAKEKMKNAWKEREIVMCPHCGKSGINNMKRYHFDNCKIKIKKL